MTDNDNLLIEKFFNQAARQQIEDNGFTERVMEQIVRQEQQSSVKTHHLSLLWTWFCVVVGLALFVVLGGWGSLKASIMVLAKRRRRRRGGGRELHRSGHVGPHLLPLRRRRRQ